jgi:predicted RNA methylase
MLSLLLEWRIGTRWDVESEFDALQAYRHGIEAVVEEEDLVIDIGTGSGILSILSVRAGAEHVFAIEGDPALERAATRVFHTTNPRVSISAPTYWSCQNGLAT